MKLEFYDLQTLYKGTIIERYEDDKALISIPDLIINNSNTEILKESISTNNIINKEDLSINKSIETVNGVICKPLYIMKQNIVSDKGDTVFVIMFDKDPKKIFYIDVTNDKPNSN